MRGKQKEQIAKKIKPTFVKHLGRYRIPTLFPALLESVCGIKGIKKVDFISSNPWDFSDELIKVIAENKNISREIHLPVQSGDDEVLKRMNRWYTRDQYIKLVENLKLKIKNLKLSTDIIVGFPGETKSQFENTVALCKSVGFYKAYIAEYSDRPLTAAHKAFKDDIPHKEKKRRWRVLESLVNKPH
jgi:tRNA-2-methylthio-N6-dimethylallyladenosine synthase